MTNTTVTTTYGNASAQSVAWIRESSYLDRHFSELNNFTVDAPDSESVKKQLQEIAVLPRNMDDELLRRYKMYDRGLQSHVASFKFEEDEEGKSNELYQNLITELFKDVLPLVYKLKLHYQRPRPFQLAAMHGIQLYPQSSLSAHCPSFPSMHSCMATVMREVIGNRLVDIYKYFCDMEADICSSRLYFGLVLPSDIAAGHQVAEKIIEDREFKIKYKL